MIHISHERPPYFWMVAIANTRLSKAGPHYPCSRHMNTSIVWTETIS